VLFVEFCEKKIKNEGVSKNYTPLKESRSHNVILMSTLLIEI
jgi:hypothetical protein